jgi:hypothetical protein
MDLDILIKTEAELAGAKAVEQQLERDIGKAKALGLRYDELEQKLVRVRALMSTATKVDGNAIDDQINKAEKLADAKLREQRIAENNKADQQTYFSNLTKESKGLAGVAVEADKATRSKKGLADGLKKLGQEIPVVGLALNALKNPFTILGIGAAYAVSYVRDFVAGIDELASAISKFGNANLTLAEFNEILFAGKGRAKEFMAALAEIANRRRTVEEVFGSVTAASSRRFGFEREKAGNERDKELKKIDAQLKAGSITPAEAESRKEAVGLRFDNDERERKVREENEKASAIATERYTSGLQAKEAEAAAKAADEQVKKREGKQKLAQRDVETSTEALTTFDKGPIGIVLKELEEKAKLQKLTPGFQRDLENYRGMREGLVNGVGVATGALGQANNNLADAQRQATEKSAEAISLRNAERSYGLQFDDQEQSVAETDAFYTSEYPGYKSRGFQANQQRRTQRRADAIIAQNQNVAVKNAADDFVTVFKQAVDAYNSEILKRIRALENNSRRQNND